MSAALGAVSMPADPDYANDLLGLFMCEESRESCDISEPSDGDEDGDGVADEEDLCAWAYDLQRDYDGDGVVTPAIRPSLWTRPSAATPPETSTVTAQPHRGRQLCPWLANADQADMDGDGKGDGCDPRPEEYNPGDMGCTFSLSDIRDPSSALHPGEGSDVRVEGVIGTRTRSGSGLYVQDPDADMYGGIFIYDGGTYSSGAVNVGDVITVSGVYSEYYGLSQIGGPEITVTGTGESVEPIVVETNCDVGTDGPLAEPLEGIGGQRERRRRHQQQPGRTLRLRRLEPR